MQWYERSTYPKQKGHVELVDKVSKDNTFNGMKSFFMAKFNDKGKCVVYPNTLTARKW